MVSIRLARPPILDNKTRAEVCWGGGRFLGKMFLLPKKSCKKELAPLFFLWTLSCLGVMMGTAGGILQPARARGCIARRAGSSEDGGSEQPYLCVPSSISCHSGGSGSGFSLPCRQKHCPKQNLGNNNQQQQYMRNSYEVFCFSITNFPRASARKVLNPSIHKGDDPVLITR